MDISFTKMQGVGNDFVLIDGRELSADWSALAIKLCDRHFGIGSDGLLVIERSERADLRMAMFNPDGTRDVCGNGLRCISRYARVHGLIASDRFTIETLAGVRAVVIGADPSRPDEVTVEMGEPLFAPVDIPMNIDLERVIDYRLPLSDGLDLSITALSTGSTHAVAFVEDLPDDAPFTWISSRVENHVLFPERTSLMWCRVEGENQLKLRIWERGAGETWGCGTGACAAAVAAIVTGRVSEDAPVTVTSKGGTLQIAWRPGEQIQMTGPAEFVYTGLISIPDISLRTYKIA